MKFSEIKSLEKKELLKKVSEARKVLVDLKLKNSMGRLENPAQIRLKRREIARLLTAVAQKG
jgi:large subunit ribosomal protein L29